MRANSRFTSTFRQSYLQFHVRLDRWARWYRRAVAEILDGELMGKNAPVITFDTLEAFTTQRGGMHVVYLTASRVPDEWAALVDKVRKNSQATTSILDPINCM